MYCQWQSPDGKQTVSVRRAVLEQLQNRVMEAFLALPGRGAEVGGILFGHTEDDRISVDEIQEVTCEHRFGPSYILSTADREVLKTALASKRALQVVGAFRSYTRRPAALDDADQQLFRTFFPDSRYVFLLLEPVSPAESHISFLSFVDGELPSKPTHPAVEVKALLATKAPELQPERGRTAQSPQPALNLPPAYRRREREEVPPPPPEPRPRRRVLLPLIACVVLSIGAAVMYELWLMARAPRWSDLKLDARRRPGGDLELTWDATSPAAVLAARGILMVTDGAAHRNLELSPDQVRGGNLVYKPNHPDVLFRLQLYGSGIRASGDSLRVMTAAAPQPVAPPPQTATVTQPAAPPPVPKPTPPPAPVRSQSDRSVSDRTEPDRTAVAATAPEPVQRVQPQVPEGIRSRIESRIVVPIQVKIDKSGRVVEAISPGDGSGLYRFLADESLRAARQWRFSPAKTAQGKPVDGRKTIDFVFGPDDAH